jgi:hypothetical protein
MRKFSDTGRDKDRDRRVVTKLGYCAINVRNLFSGLAIKERLRIVEDY